MREYARRIRNTDAERRACNVRLIAERRYGELMMPLARAPTASGGDTRSAPARGEPKLLSPYAQALADTSMSTQAASRFKPPADGVAGLDTCATTTSHGGLA